MNSTYALLELRRTVRDYASMFFIAVLPAFFYLIFGASQDFGDERFGNGNVTMYIMVSMAAYGAVTATTGIGGMAAVERMQGWGRQLGLTPMGDGAYIVIKALVSVTIAAVPVALIYVLGVLTGAEGSWQAWLVSGLVVVVGATVFALWGLAFGLAFRSEAAVSAASGSIVILAFLGNIFFPLSGTLLTIAKFTPLYGYVGLARYPITEGELADTTGGPLVQEALWVPALNVAVWTVILALVTVWLVRRSRGRQ
ncbi:ABC-2 type transporter [Aeromicrobium marinum DSM 15272]|uniref:ABC-2 type transporter n=1 Tax=Aeromicrobium marinum DSM 15272 TaxID=585531 RepID=E2S8K0_9ACTN|nr:ABC transporter permease [Aeromicrobium marinum]EFQ84505.1 ABC-2 type transporter [Aeromicrobium marinum DSM 15272]